MPFKTVAGTSPDADWIGILVGLAGIPRTTCMMGKLFVAGGSPTENALARRLAEAFARLRIERRNIVLDVTLENVEIIAVIKRAHLRGNS